MRRLSLVVLVSQLAYLSLGACVLCLCPSSAASPAGDCCARSVRAGEDCCAPEKARLTADSQRTMPTDSALTPLAAPARAPVALAAFPVPAPETLPFTSLTRPQVILRI